MRLFIKTCLLWAFASTVVAGTYSNYYFTNNSNHPLKISLDTEFDVNLEQGKYWSAFEGEVAPYQKVTLLQVSRNTGIKNGKHFKFTSHIVDPAVIGKEIVYEFDLVGTLLGSNVKHFLSANNESKREILANYELDQASYSFDDYPVNIYSYSWLDSKNADIYESASFVFDSPKSALPDASQANQIKILNYNTQLMPFYSGVVNKPNHPDIRALHIPLLIANDYDVVVVEELFDRDLRQTFTSALAQKYPFHTNVLNHDTSRFLTGGVTIFSKWPIEHEQSHQYNDCSGGDCLAAKGFEEAVINKLGTRYHIYGTHTQADNPALAIKQLQQLYQSTAQAGIPKNEAVIVVGDLNINLLNSEQLAGLNHALQPEIVANKGYIYSLDPSINTMSTSSNKERLDYILPLKMYRTLVSGESQVFLMRDLSSEAMWPDFDLSDHFPIEAFFQF